MHALQGPALGPRLFRFVVVADTHVNPQDGQTSSPFAANALANERAAAVFADVNRWHPAFVVHVGDIVHPVPELPSFEPACARFKALAAAVQAPLYLVSGNHDVGDKPVDWMPAGTVTQEHVEAYRRIFGPDFHSFDAEGCHCVVLDAQIINSGLPAEAEQRAWLEADLARHRDSRTFFFIHYPPYVSDRHEPSSYDNIDEPGRTWLLDLIARYQPEALFAGHVHNQWFDLFERTSLYILPSTAFVRQDYTELYRAAPLRDYGRDDSPKLGYYLVDVHRHGHVAHFIRSDGATASGPFGASSTAPESPVHTRTNLAARVGVDMRHAWIEWVDVPATGGVQEFERKRVRNDYPAIALWEMGVRKLRVPLQDLLEPPVRARMALLARLGHRFTAYVFGLPRGDAIAALHAHRGLIEALEVVTVWDRAQALAPELAALRRELGLTVYLSKLRRHEDAKFDGSKFNHFINHGFVPAERGQMEAFLATPAGRCAVDGFVVRVPLGRDPWDEVEGARAIGNAIGTGVCLQVRLAADNPAEPVNDDLLIANRVAETVCAAFAGADCDVFFDTFMDVDRNYFPRHGFVDRRYDPRLASRVYRHLHGVLGAHAGGLRAAGAGGRGNDRWCALQAESDRWVLLAGAGNGQAPIDLSAAPVRPGARFTAFSLATGARATGTLAGPRHAGERAGPVLLHFG